MCAQIRDALGTKRRYELRAIAKAAGLQGVSRLNKHELEEALHEACRSNRHVRDRVLEQLDLTLWHRHWRRIAAISLISSILGILGFFSFLAPDDDLELLSKIEAITNNALEEKLRSFG